MISYNALADIGPPPHTHTHTRPFHILKGFLVYFDTMDMKILSKLDFQGYTQETFVVINDGDHFRENVLEKCSENSSNISQVRPRSLKLLVSSKSRLSSIFNLS